MATPVADSSYVTRAVARPTRPLSPSPTPSPSKITATLLLLQLNPPTLCPLYRLLLSLSYFLLGVFAPRFFHSFLGSIFHILSACSTRCYIILAFILTSLISLLPPRLYPPFILLFLFSFCFLFFTTFLVFSIIFLYYYYVYHHHRFYYYYCFLPCFFLILSFLSTLRHVRLVAPPFCISARCSFYSPTAGLYLAPSSSHLAPVPDALYEIFSWSAPFCPYTLSVHYVLLYSTFCFYPSDLPLSFSHVSTLSYAVLVSWLAPSPFMLYRSTRANEPRSSLKRCLLDPLITRWRARLHGV